MDLGPNRDDEGRVARLRETVEVGGVGRLELGVEVHVAARVGVDAAHLVGHEFERGRVAGLGRELGCNARGDLRALLGVGGCARDGRARGDLGELEDGWGLVEGGRGAGRVGGSLTDGGRARLVRSGRPNGGRNGNRREGHLSGAGDGQDAGEQRKGSSEGRHGDEVVGDEV